MTKFNPYLKWLAIREDPKKIHHYQLLGVEVFEPDTDVISTNADRQINFVRSFLDSEHSAHAQELLNHLAKARKCLLNAEKKATYDARLRQVISVQEGPKKQQATPVESSPPVSNPVDSVQPVKAQTPFAGPSIRADGRADQTARRKQASKKMTLNIIGVIGGGVAAVVVAILIINSSLFTKMQDAINGSNQSESSRLDDRVRDVGKVERPSETKKQNRRDDSRQRAQIKPKSREKDSANTKSTLSQKPTRQNPTNKNVSSTNPSENIKPNAQQNSGNSGSNPTQLMSKDDTGSETSKPDKPEVKDASNDDVAKPGLAKNENETPLTPPKMEGEGLLPIVVNDPGVDFNQAKDLFAELVLETIQIRNKSDRANRLRKLIDFYAFHGAFDSCTKIALLIEQEKLGLQTGIEINAESIDRFLVNVKTRVQARTAFSGFHRLTKYYFELGDFSKAKEIADKAVQFSKTRKNVDKTGEFADEFIYLNVVDDLKTRYERALPRFNDENAWATGRDIGNYLVLVENKYQEGMEYWSRLKVGSEKDIADLAQNAKSAKDIRSIADLFYRLGEEKSTPKDRLFMNCAKGYYVRCKRELPREEQLKIQEKIKGIDQFLKPVFRGGD